MHASKQTKTPHTYFRWLHFPIYKVAHKNMNAEMPFAYGIFAQRVCTVVVNFHQLVLRNHYLMTHLISNLAREKIPGFVHFANNEPIKKKFFFLFHFFRKILFKKNERVLFAKEGAT